MIDDAIIIAVLKKSGEFFLYLLKLAILEGQVVGEHQENLANVTVKLKTADGNLIATDSTYLSGRFIFPKVKEGKYELFADYDGNSYALDKIYLPRGKTTFVQLQLPSQTQIKSPNHTLRENEPTRSFIPNPFPGHIED